MTFNVLRAQVGKDNSVEGDETMAMLFDALGSDFQNQILAAGLNGPAQKLLNEKATRHGHAFVVDFFPAQNSEPD